MIEKLQLKNLQNLYCDGVCCALGEFIDVYSINWADLEGKMTDQMLEDMCKFTFLKNKMAGVEKMFIRMPRTTKTFFDEYKMKGRLIVPATKMFDLVTDDIVGDRIMLEIDNLIDITEGYLSQVSDFLGRTESPVMIKIGKDLKEVGQIVNRYNMSPIETLENFGFLDRECYLQGLNFIDKDDQKLIKDYDAVVVFSPRSDGEEGLGGINLYNFDNRGLKFVFSSGKCYNIDMLAEGKLALINTANLLYKRGLVSQQRVMEALQTECTSEVTTHK